MSEMTETSPGGSAPRQRDWWDRAEIIGKILTALLPALIVAAIGLFGQRFTQSLENTRLYTELLTRREQSDTELRKDMFSVLMREFLVGGGPNGATERPAPRTASARADALAQDLEEASRQLLKLQLLAFNFSESLTLSPLFQRLDNDLFKLVERADRAGLKARAQVQGLRKRLVGLAKRVSANQIAAIKAGGAAFTISVPLARAGKGFVWPYDDPNAASAEAPSGGGPGPGAVRCGEITRQFQVFFHQPDPDLQRVRVEVGIQKIAGPASAETQDGPVYRGAPQTVESKFDLDFFNFPLVDNTRLSDDQRFALVMTEFDENEIVAAALCFSGTYSSVRDRPFLNEILESLSR